MTNTLTKRTQIKLLPEIQEQAEQPYRPAQPARVDVRYEHVCESVPTSGGAGGPVRITYPTSSYVWVPYPDMPGGGRWEPPGPNVILDLPNGGGFETVCRDVAIYTTVAAVPEQPYQPATSYRPASVSTDYNLGWNAGARSIDLMLGSGSFTFLAPDAVGIVVGLNGTEQGTAYLDIDHGFYLANGVFRVMEAGSVVFYGGAFAPADTFKIVRSGTHVLYLRNDALVYTSAKPSLGPVFIDASMYSGGDSIDEPVLVASDDTSGTAVGVMRPLAAAGGDVAFSISAAAFQPLAGQSGVLPRVQASMRPLTGLASDRIYGGAACSLLPLTGAATSGLEVPPYANSHGQIFPMYGQANGLSGTLGNAFTTMWWMTTLSSDRVYGEVRGRMLEPIGWAADRAYVQPASLLPRASLVALGGATAQLLGPVAELESRGTAQPKSEFRGTAPAAQLRAFSGGGARLREPVAALAASGVLEEQGQAALVAPAAILTAHGVMGATGSATLSMGIGRLQAFGGAIARGNAGRASLQAVGTTGAIGRVETILPLFGLVAHGETEAFGRAELVGPALVPAPSGRAWMVAPPFQLVAIGSVTVVHALETFAINLLANDEAGIGYEVTRYTNFPFRQVVRLHGDYYGVAADGLYKLGGDTDAGQPRAPWSWRTCITDFGSPQFKTVVSAYLGGRLGPAAEITIFPGEQPGVSYGFETPRGAGAQTYRQKFGRGIRQNRYYALGASGTGELRIDTIDFEVLTSKRKI